MTKHGFSLIELSIVLVILGLLTGGILTGQNLIRAAELRSVTTEYQAYQTAVNTFRDKYFALPGDMRNATAFWGSAGGSGTIGDGCESAAGASGTQTCNGNGNGLIEAGAGDEYGEPFTFWQHLANAGLISGNYDGKSGSTSGLHMSDANLPRSKLPNSYYLMRHIGNGVPAVHFTGNYGNVFELTTISTNATGSGNLNAEEAWNIDTKIDDGLPGQGSVTSWVSSFRNCATTNIVATAIYDLQNGNDCPLTLKSGF